jgi:hypothetical protein
MSLGFTPLKSSTEAVDVQEHPQAGLLQIKLNNSFRFFRVGKAKSMPKKEIELI